MLEDLYGPEEKDSTTTFLESLMGPPLPPMGENAPSGPETALPAPQVAPSPPATPRAPKAAPRANAAVPAPVPETPPVPPAPPPVEEPSPSYDPIRVLQNRYSKQVEEAAAARKYDLDEQEKQKYLMQASSLAHHAAGNTGTATLMGGKAAELMGSPLRTQALEREATLREKAADTHVKELGAIKAGWALDPNSPLAHDARMAFVSSPMFDDVATNMAKAQGIPVIDAKKQLYAKSRQMSPLGMGEYLNIMKQKADYTLKGSQEAEHYARTRQLKAAAHQLELENSQTEIQNAARNNPDSVTSFTAREALEYQFPGISSRYEEKTGKPWKKATFTQIQGYDPHLAQTAERVIAWRIDEGRRQNKQMFINETYQFKEAAPTTDLRGNAIPNFLGSEPEGIEIKNQAQAADDGMRAGLDALSILDRGSINASGRLVLHTGDGDRLRKDVAMLRANSNRLSAGVVADLAAQETALGREGAKLSNTVFKGTEAVVRRAVQELSGQFQAQAAKAEVRPQVLAGPTPPENPPLMVKHTTFSDEIPSAKGKQKVQGIIFPKMGKWENVAYFVDPATGRWSRPIVGYSPTQKENK